MKNVNAIYVWLKTTTLLFVCILFLLYYNNTIAQNNAEINIPKTYIANYTKEPIEIDGLGTDKSWEKAPYSDLFIDIEGIIKPKYKTRIKMLWDHDYIYFLAELEEPHVWGNLKQRDTIIYYNNDFEIFIDPDGDSHNYYEFEFNVLNTIWDLFLTKPYREGALVLNEWDSNGLKSAVHINGTLNNPIDIDTGWSIEVAIPLTIFKGSYYENVSPKEKFWRINFSRVHWDFQLENGVYQRKKNDKDTFAREYNWVWSPQGVIAMHQPETWGYVYFSSKEVGVDSFKIPKDDHIKWYLYKLHNQYRDKKAVKKSIEMETTILNKKVEPTLEIHESGYNIWVKSPFTGKKLLITEDGKFISK